jgi:hypothetical protein
MLRRSPKQWTYHSEALFRRSSEPEKYESAFACLFGISKRGSEFYDSSLKSNEMVRRSDGIAAQEEGDSIDRHVNRETLPQLEHGLSPMPIHVYFLLYVHTVRLIDEVAGVLVRHLRALILY